MRFTSPVQTLIGACALVAAPLFVSCRDSTEPLLWGRYLLRTVDGSPLPYETVNVLNADGTRVVQTLLADTIQILTNTDFRRSGSSSLVSPLFQTPEIAPFGMTGTYARHADTLTMGWLVYPPGPPGPYPVTELLIMEGATLRTRRTVGPHCTDGTPQCSERRLVDYVYVAR